MTRIVVYCRSVRVDGVVKRQAVVEIPSVDFAPLAGHTWHSVASSGLPVVWEHRWRKSLPLAVRARFKLPVLPVSRWNHRRLEIVRGD